MMRPSDLQQSGLGLRAAASGLLADRGSGASAKSVDALVYHNDPEEEKVKDAAADASVSVAF